jgi:hypothetical protein
MFPGGLTNRLVLWALGLTTGVLVYLPALATPRFLDDYIHTLMLEGRFPVPRSPFNLYDFIGDENRELFLERGLLPWWTHPELKLRFFRPLSSILMWLDQRVLGLSVLGQHLHSFLWWGLCVLAARRLLNRMLPRRAALLATLIFAFAPCHAFPIGWTANRNALVALVLGTLALDAQERFGMRGERRAGLSALLLFSLALLAGEYALCFGGYVLALALFSTGSRAQRLASVLPFALPAAGYLFIRGWYGYGSVGSGFYVDPLTEPLDFLVLAPFRLSVLLAQGWLTISTETWLLGSLRWLVFPTVLAAALALALLLKRLHASLASDLRTNASWLLLGSLLALLPVLPAVPSARLLGIALLGIAANIALLLDHAWFSPEQVERAHRADYAGVFVVLLAFAHLVHGPVSATLGASTLREDARNFELDVAKVRDRLQELGASEVVLLRAGVDSLFGPFALVVSGGPWTRWSILSDPGHMLALRRDAFTLELVTSSESSLYTWGEFNLFRAPNYRMKVGEQVVSRNFKLRALEVGEYGPTDALVTFNTRPSKMNALWMWRQARRLSELRLPAVGAGLPSDP